MRAVVDAVRERHAARPHRRPPRQPRALRPPHPRAPPRRRHPHQRRRGGAPRRPGWRVARCSSCSGWPPAATGGKTSSRGWRRRPSSTAGGWRPPPAGSASRARPRSWRGAPTGTSGSTSSPSGTSAGRTRRSSTTRNPSGGPDACAPRPPVPASSGSSCSSVIDDLTASAARPRRWSEHAAWAQRWLGRLLGGAGRRERWDDPAERRAAERVDEALHRLGALDAVEAAVTLDVFHRTLELELEHDLGRVGRFGDGVLVGSVEMGIGLDLDLVVILGLAEGSFPATVRDDSLLPDHERARTGGELALRADRVERQHHQLLAALAGARRQLLCVPRGDLRRSVERVPSRWVLDACTHLAESDARWWAPDLAAAREPWVRHVASFDAGLRLLDVPSTGQEHRLRALLATDGDLRATDDAGTALGAEVISARRSRRFTRFDGNLAGQPIPSPVDRITSPTRLERWADCPHRHLVEDLLRAAPVENPEDNLMITPLDKGSLVHAALEEFLLRVLDRPLADRPQPGQPWTRDDLALLLQIGGALLRPVRGPRARRPPHLLDARPPPDPRRPRGHPRLRLRAPRGAPHRPAVRRARVRVHQRVDRRRRGGPARRAHAAGARAHRPRRRRAPTAPSTSSTTRPAPTTRASATCSAATPSAAAPSSSSRSTAWPGAWRPRTAGRRCTPSTGSSPRRAASSAAATTSPTRCWSARSRCST